MSFKAKHSVTSVAVSTVEQLYIDEKELMLGSFLLLCHYGCFVQLFVLMLFSALSQESHP